MTLHNPFRSVTDADRVTRPGPVLVAAVALTAGGLFVAGCGADTTTATTIEPAEELVETIEPIVARPGDEAAWADAWWDLRVVVIETEEVRDELLPLLLDEGDRAALADVDLETQFVVRALTRDCFLPVAGPWLQIGETTHTIDFERDPRSAEGTCEIEIEMQLLFPVDRHHRHLWADAVADLT